MTESESQLKPFPWTVTRPSGPQFPRLTWEQQRYQHHKAVIRLQGVNFYTVLRPMPTTSSVLCKQQVLLWDSNKSSKLGACVPQISPNAGQASEKTQGSVLPAL